MIRKIPAKTIETSLEVANSIFISTAAPAFSVEEARAFIQSIQQKYPDASHHIPVFIIGHGASLTAHSSDDGEPSGTAGRPALAVLEGSGFGDIVVTITRFYGGTKLGTGGLVRAYSESMRTVLNAMPAAQKLATTKLRFKLPYSLYEPVKLSIARHAGVIEHEIFEEAVLLEASFKDKDLENFVSALTDLSHGSISPAVVSKNPNTIMPYSPEDQ